MAHPFLNLPSAGKPETLQGLVDEKSRQLKVARKEDSSRNITLPKKSLFGRKKKSHLLLDTDCIGTEVIIPETSEASSGQPFRDEALVDHVPMALQCTSQTSGCAYGYRTGELTNMSADDETVRDKANTTLDLHRVWHG